MPKSQSDKIYESKVIRCSECHFTVGTTAADSQILILESGLILFNAAFIQCVCSHNIKWIAPLLPDVAVNLDSLYPDGKELEKRAKIGITRLAHNRFRVRVKNQYIGVYTTKAEAVKIRDKALAESLGYLPKTLTELHQG